MKTTTNSNNNMTADTRDSSKLRNRSGQAGARKTGKGTCCKADEVTGEEDMAVYCEGPEPDRNHEGDEIPTWVVFVAQNCGETLRSKLYRCLSLERARGLAQAMAWDRHLDLVDEARPA